MNAQYPTALSSCTLALRVCRAGCATLALVMLVPQLSDAAWNDLFKSKSRSTDAAATASSSAGATTSPKKSLFSRKPKASTWNLSTSDTASIGTPKKSWTESLSSGFKKATAAVTPKPSVKQADDPTALHTKMKPPTVEMHAAYARLAETRGDLVRAEQHYQDALKLDPQCTAAMLGLARLNHRQGKLDDAMRGYHQVAQLTPQDPVPLNDLGLCYARMGQLDQAVAALQAAVQRKPDSALYRNNLATVLVEANRADEAVAQLRSTHGEAAAHYNVAVLLYRRGQTQAAEQYFSQAVQLDPNLTAAREMMQKAQGSAASLAMRTNNVVSNFQQAYQSTGDAMQQAANGAQQAYLTPPAQRVVPAAVPTTLAPGNAPGPSQPPAPYPPTMDTTPRRIGPFGYVPPATTPVPTGPTMPLQYPGETMPHSLPPTGYSATP